MYVEFETIRKKPNVNLKIKASRCGWKLLHNGSMRLCLPVFSPKKIANRIITVERRKEEKSIGHFRLVGDDAQVTSLGCSSYHSRPTGMEVLWNLTSWMGSTTQQMEESRIWSPFVANQPALLRYIMVNKTLVQLVKLFDDKLASCSWDRIVSTWVSSSS